MRLNSRNVWVALVFFHFLQVTLTSEAEDFDPLDHILSTSGSGLHNFNDEVSVDEGNPSVHLDERCRCTCPPFDVPNVARMGGKIYTGQVDKAQDCSCMNIVLPSIPDLKATNFKLMEEQVCPTCRCLYQRRNLTMIYGVVVFLCILISGFAIYLFVTQIVCQRFNLAVSYKEQRDDEIVMEEVTEQSNAGQDQHKDPGQECMIGMNRRSPRFPYLNFIWNRQSQWRQDLDQQQRNIYTDHTMLN